MLVTLVLAAATPGLNSYVRHPSSFCAGTHCSGAQCRGGLYASANATLAHCHAQCDAENCACFQWRDPAAHHPSPTEPACLTTNVSAATSRSGYGYAAWVNADAPTPPPAPPAPPSPAPGPTRVVEYTTRGAIDVDTNENTLFLWQGELYVLENIPCYYSEHASRWDARYANASYARIRRMDDGAIVTNITSSIGFGFLSAFVDEDLGAVWLFGSLCNRCVNGNQGCGEGTRKVQAWSNRPNRSSLLVWDTAVAAGTFPTYNVEVTRVRSSATEQEATGLPPHRYAMILELSPRFALNNNADGDLTQGWFPIPGAIDPPDNGGPSIRWNPLDSMYYAILGGTHVELIRTRDFKVWERSPNRPFIEPSPADGTIAPYAGFPELAQARGFVPMENTSRWDWNSNDADVCCMNSKADVSYVVWGAGTQGRTPHPPLTKANHCANVIATANISLPQLLANHFKSLESDDTTDVRTRLDAEALNGSRSPLLKSDDDGISSALAAATSSPSRSQYPMLHIGDKLNCSAEQPCTKDDGADGNGRDFPYALTNTDAEALGAFTMLHFSPKHASTVKLMHTIAKSPIVKYTETKPVCGGSSGQDTPYSSGCNSTFNFETGGFRKDAQVYLAGNLTQAISAVDTKLELCLGIPNCCGRYATPLVPSTQTNGSYSDYEGSRYVTFMRVKDELMKIVAVETYPNPDPEIDPEKGAKCQRLTVERGLDGSNPQAAAKGAAVLAPLYVHTPIWGSDPKASGRLSYQADYQSDYAWSSLANFTVGAVQQLGFDGAWFDSYSPSEVANGADPGGLKVSIWNLATGRPYTPREAMDAQKERLQKVWHSVHAQLGFFPTIWANNFENWANATKGSGVEKPGDVELMVSSTGFKPFDGCSLESWSGAAQKRNGEGATCWPQTGDISELSFRWNDAETWVSRTNTMIDAALKNLSVAAMTESAGCQSQIQTYWPIKFRVQLDLMHYASYLLTVAHAGGTVAAATGPLLGTTAFFAADTRGDGQARGMSRAMLWEPYTWDLGAPTTVHSNVTMYDVTVGEGPSVYVRYFERAVVIVNPGNVSAVVATALRGGPFEDKLTGEKGISAVRMAPRTGRVLLRQ